ncbi:MAG: hemerythrin family protein [Magnetococcales bacterium]|nr:hemerythrin family protein [Magnetococcales bacterium]
MSVGVDAMDQDHRQLMELVNQLMRALHAGEVKGVIGDVLLELLHYTETHFRREERLMMDHAFPDLESHKAEHQRMTEKLVEFERMFREEDVALSQDVLRFLQHWLVHHIQGVDQEYARHIAPH